MSNLILCDVDGAQIRKLEWAGVRYLVNADLCRSLGLTNPTEAVRSLDEDEKTTLSIAEGGAEFPELFANGVQSVSLVTEAGAYQLTFRSRKAIAKKFRRWLAHEVIPSIRRTGSYTAPVSSDRIGQEDVKAIASQVVDLLASNRAAIVDLIAMVRQPQRGEAIPDGLRKYIANVCRGRLILEGYGFTRAKFRQFVTDVRLVLEAMAYTMPSLRLDNDMGTDPIVRKSEAPFGMWHVHRDNLPQLDEAYRRVLAATPGMKRGGDDGQKFLPFDAQ